MRIVRLLNMRTVCVAGLALAMAGMAIADDWNMYLRNPAHTSFNPFETQLGTASMGGIQPAWTFSTQGAPIASAVTIMDGALYFGDWAGYFHALRVSDGAELWSQFVGISAKPDSAFCT